MEQKGGEVEMKKEQASEQVVLGGWRRWRLQEKPMESAEEAEPRLKGRVGHSATYLPSLNQVLFVGGATPEEAFNEVWRLELTSGQLYLDKPKGYLPPRYEHATWLEEETAPDTPHSANYKLLVWGGADMHGNKHDLWEYIVNTRKWQKIEQQEAIPSERTVHANFIYVGKRKELLLLGGGSRGPEPINDVQLYVLNSNTKKWSIKETTGDTPTPRQGHILLVSHNKVYCHGGLVNHIFLDDLRVLDLDSKVWSVVDVERGPCARASHGGVLHDRKLYLFGGFGADGALNDLWRLDFETLEWMQITTIHSECPSPRLDFAFTFCLLNINNIKEEEEKGDSSNKSSIHLINQENDGGDAIEMNKNVPCLLIHGGMDAQGKIYNDCYIIRIG